MTASSRGRVVIAGLIAVLVFAAAFAVRKASAGETHAPAQPAPIVLPSTPVHTSGVALPAATLPALRHTPRASAPAASRSSTPAQTAPAAPSTPAAPSKPTAPSSGPVLVG
jgi:hypothetical protein